MVFISQPSLQKNIATTHVHVLYNSYLHQMLPYKCSVILSLENVFHCEAKKLCFTWPAGIECTTHDCTRNLSSVTECNCVSIPVFMGRMIMADHDRPSLYLVKYGVGSHCDRERKHSPNLVWPCTSMVLWSSPEMRIRLLYKLQWYI